MLRIKSIQVLLSARGPAAALQAQDLGGALTTALKGEQPGTHHMPAMYKAVVRFTDDACQARAQLAMKLPSFNSAANQWQWCFRLNAVLVHPVCDVIAPHSGAASALL